MKRRYVPFDEARATILAAAESCRMPRERLDLDEALGRVLVEEVIAGEPFPAFDNSAMDGFAVRAADVRTARADAPITLTVVETVPAGHPAAVAVAEGQASRIMTGAPIPLGADAVIPVEHTASADDTTPASTVQVRSAVAVGDNIRPAGEDFPIGERLLAAGQIVEPGTIALLAALGHAWVDVAVRPRVAILSTGDELVPPDHEPGPGQIRDSNSHMLRAMVRAAGAEPGPCWQLADDPTAVEEAVMRVVDHAEIIVTIGGVSAGDFDPVKQVLDRLGSIELWRVGMRPGQPQAFGAVRGRPFFGLPGNPVSSAVVFEMLVRPALWHMMGRSPLDRPVVRAVLAESVASRVGRRDFLRVRLEPLAESEVRGLGVAWRARLTGTQSSGAVSSVLKADGLAVVAEEMAAVEAGSLVTVLRWQ